ncbi:diaminopimelate decarboxylase [Candidatus Roizmanbacteria bacterium]|nr:diaminopimelate decarboxylase [Candidatus Roizmanbacteria bacterium]
MQKPLPFTKKQLETIIKQHPTPFHIYDEAGIRKTARKLARAFSGFPFFRNYFAVKALPNPVIMKILVDEGMGMDASSYAELMLCERVGITGENIMFTSNDTPQEEYEKAFELGAMINLDDISHIDYLEKHVGIPKIICFRYNPGSLRKGGAHSHIIGKPEEAKFGATRKQLFEGYAIMKKKGVKRFGIHTMLASNELDYRYFVETARMLFELIKELSKRLDISFEFVNLGGGIGIPYRPQEEPFDLDRMAKDIGKLYKEIILGARLPPPKLFMENGRMVTGPHGYLVSKVLHLKKTYKNFIGLDACMANLMRPAMYGAYHHITVLGKEDKPTTTLYDVVGSLCENNDKFAIDRRLPKVKIHDIIVIHDTGGHGHAMGFNYNGKLRTSELLLKKNGEMKLIRRAETVEDYFATLNFFA